MPEIDRLAVVSALRKQEVASSELGCVRDRNPDEHLLGRRTWQRDTDLRKRPLHETRAIEAHVGRLAAPYVRDTELCHRGRYDGFTRARHRGGIGGGVTP